MRPLGRPIHLISQPHHGRFGSGEQFIVLEDMVEIHQPSTAMIQGGNVVAAIPIRPEPVGLLESLHFAAS
jgi:hypothetical protein